MNWSDYFTYRNGGLVWVARKCRNRHDKAWNTRFANKPAGTIGSNGYVKVRLSGRVYYAHRIIWEMFYGRIPDGYEIDHINHDRSDNRIENLRCVHPHENDKNLSLPKNSSSGAIGVSFDNDRMKYRAYIVVNGKYKTIGRYSTKDQAIEARIEYSELHGFHDNHGK